MLTRHFKKCHDIIRLRIQNKLLLQYWEEGISKQKQHNIYTLCKAKNKLQWLYNVHIYCLHIVNTIGWGFGALLLTVAGMKPVVWQFASVYGGRLNTSGISAKYKYNYQIIKKVKSYIARLVSCTTTSLS